MKQRLPNVPVDAEHASSSDTFRAPGVAPRSTATRSHHSTHSATNSCSFIGRERELAHICDLLNDPHCRLVTLTGPGGVGKTRLALKVAVEIERALLVAGAPEVEIVVGVGLGVGSEQSALPAPVEVVYLTPVVDARFVMARIAHELGIREFQTLPALESLKYHLASRRLILVLDNFEHVIDAALSVSELLGSAPQLKLLVTSREPLHIYGEREVAVAPLSVPEADEKSDDEATITSRKLEEHSAVRLFIDRTRAVKHNFTPTPQQLREIAEICRRVDGLPLAIELAAARTRTLSMGAILSQMEGNPLTLLVGGAPDWPDRHRTMRAAIAWSYDLLDNDEQLMLRRLAVFADSFTEEAVRAVCTNRVAQLHVISNSWEEGRERRRREEAAGRARHAQHVRRERRIPRLLTSLAEKNLICFDERAWERTGGERYFMVQTIRQYAREQLADAGEEHELRERHARFYSQVASHRVQDILGSRQVEALKQLASEQSNITAALHYCAETNQALEQVTLASAMVWHWYLRGQFEEGSAWLASALAASEAAEAKAKARGQREASYEDEERGSADPSELARAKATALFGAGLLARERGDYAGAKEALEESTQIYSQLGIGRVLSYVNSFNALTAKDEGQPAEAQRLLEESLSLSVEAEDKWGEGLALLHMARFASDNGELSRAGKLYRRSLAAFREVDRPAEQVRSAGPARQGGRGGHRGERWGMGQALTGLGNVAYWERRFVQARDFYEQGLKLFREIEARVMLSWVYTSLGHCAMMLGKYGEAVELYKRGLPTHRELSNLRSIAYTLNGLGEAARARRDYAQAEEYYGQSYLLFKEIDDSAGIAWSLHNQGLIAYHGGDLREGEELLKASLSLFEEIGHPRGVPAAISGLASMAVLRGDLPRAATLFAASKALLTSESTALEPVDEEEYRRVEEEARRNADAAEWRSGWEAGRLLAAGEGGLQRVVAYAMRPPNSNPDGGKQPPTAEAATDTQHQGGAKVLPEELTKREIEVLSLLAEGLTNKVIAERLHLSPRTINAHLRTIFHKLGVTSRSAATRAAVDKRLV